MGTVASTLIAGIGLLFAGAQLLVMNRSAAMDRRIALEGVVVSWRPVEAPRGPEEDGTAAWLYEIRVHNPGRMPVDDVQVDWHFQCDVRRRRSGALEPPTRAPPAHRSSPSGRPRAPVEPPTGHELPRSGGGTTEDVRDGRIR